MEKQEAMILFNCMHPHFFEQEYLQNLSAEWIFDEMVLKLDEFDPHMYEKPLDASISFDFHKGIKRNCYKRLRR